MKKKIIISLSIIILLVSCSLIYYNQLNKKIEPVKSVIIEHNKDNRGDQMKKEIETLNEQTTVTPTKNEPTTTANKVNNEDNTSTDTMDQYATLMLKYLITNQMAYTFTDRYLKVKYPERFTPETMESSIVYIANFFKTYTGTSQQLYTDFHW